MISSADNGMCARHGIRAGLEGLCELCLLEFGWQGFEGESPANGAPAGGGWRRVGDYELETEIARGGMGVVYRARQVSLNRVVAVKMILVGPLASQAQVERFQLEAQASAGLDHPHIVPVFELGRHDGWHFFSMKLIEGDDLARQMAARQWPAETRAQQEPIARLIETIAGAVHFAHQRGILHRDLKPTNILLDRSGTPFVSDFGLARLIEGADAGTLTTAVIGTPAYMAPEQAAGRMEGITVGADIYSLGAILYELLAGRPPHQARTPLETIRQVVETEVLPLEQINPSVDRDLATICLKCLRRDPTERYGSAQDLADDLGRWLRGEFIRARRISRTEKLLDFVRRNRALVAMASVLALGLVMGGIALVDRNRGLREALARTLAAESEAREKLHWVLLAQARQERQSGRMNQRQDALKTLERAAELGSSAELRTEIVSALARYDLAIGQVAPAWFENQASTMDFTADLAHYLSAEPEGGFSLRKTSNGVIARRYNSGREATVRYLAFGGGDKSALVGYADGWAEAWALDDGAPWWQTSGWYPLARVFTALHPTGAAVAYGDEDGLVWVASRASGTERLISSEPELVVALGFDPSGEVLLVVRRNGAEAFVWAESRSCWRVAATFYHASPAWSNDGRYVALSTRSGYQIWVCDAASGQLIQRLNGHEHEARFMAFHPNGRRLVSVGWDGALILWDAMSGVELVRARGWPRALRISTDGARLGLCSNTTDVATMEMVPMEVFRELDGGPPTSGHVRSIGVRYDGRWVATISNTELRLWDVAAGKVAWSEPVEETDWATVVFTPYGDELIHSVRSHGIYRRALLLDDTGEAQRIALGPREPVAPGRPGNLVGIHHGSGDWWVERPDLGKLVHWPRGQPEAEIPLIDVSRWDAPVLSPDRRWVVAGGSTTSDLQVWDLTRDEMVQRLPLRPGACFQFSPDGRWLVTGTDREYRMWKVGSWEPGRSWAARLESETAGGIFFSADQKHVAVTHGRGEIELLETRDFSRLVSLQPPVALRTGIVRWSLAGNQLFMLSVGHRLVSWDIAAIRRELSARGLDW